MPPCGYTTATTSTGAIAAAATAAKNRRSLPTETTAQAAKITTRNTLITALAAPVAAAMQERHHDPTVLGGEQRTQTDGHPESERQPTDGDVGDRADCEPQRSGPTRMADRLADDQVGKQRGQRRADDSHGPDPDGCAEHGEEHAIADRVMAGEPEVVPHPEPIALDEADAEELCGQVGAAPTQHDRQQCKTAGQRERHRSLDLGGHGLIVAQPEAGRFR